MKLRVFIELLLNALLQSVVFVARPPAGAVKTRFSPRDVARIWAAMLHWPSAFIGSSRHLTANRARAAPSRPFPAGLFGSDAVQFFLRLQAYGKFLNLGFATPAQGS
jgi:hypothetical protein